MESVIDIDMVGAALFVAGLVFGMLCAGQKRDSAALSATVQTMNEEMKDRPGPFVRVCRDDPDVVEWHDPEAGEVKRYRFDGKYWREAAASRAVMTAIASAPDRCPHGVRRPHECKECADAVPASGALEWAEREFAAARQSPGEPVPVETTAEESLGDASEPVYRLTIRDDRSDVIDACPALLDLDPGHYELHARPESAEGDSE